MAIIDKISVRNTSYDIGANSDNIVYDSNNSVKDKIDEYEAIIPSSASSSNKLATVTDLPTVPTKTSDLTNDSGFITNVVNDLTNYYLKTQTYTKTEVDTLIGAISTMHFEVVQSLPTTNIKTNVIYLVPRTEPETSNTYDEYINLDGTTAGYEKIGSTDIDLSDYVTTTDLNTALVNYTTTTDLNTLLGGYIAKSNTTGLVKNDGTIDTNTYALASAIPGIATASTVGTVKPDGTTITVDANGTISSSGGDLSNYIQKSATEGLVKNDGTIDTNEYAKTSEVSAIKKTRYTITATNWSNSVDANGYYTYTITLNPELSMDYAPNVDIAGANDSTFSTDAEKEAYDLLDECNLTAANTLVLYAKTKPETTFYIWVENKINSSGGEGIATSVVGTVENGTAASKTYAVGEHFIRNDKFCTAIVTIANGATLTLNTNYVEGTIAENITKRVNYSATEHVIGTWINGETLYEKTINCGNLPNTTEKLIDANIGVNAKAVSISGIAMDGDGSSLPIVFVFPSDITWSIAVYYYPSNYQLTQYRDKIRIITAKNFSNSTAYMTIQYIKL